MGSQMQKSDYAINGHDKCLASRDLCCNAVALELKSLLVNCFPVLLLLEQPEFICFFLHCSMDHINWMLSVLLTMLVALLEHGMHLSNFAVSLCSLLQQRNPSASAAGCGRYL